jgi:hypothetical protein
MHHQHKTAPVKSSHVASTCNAQDKDSEPAQFLNCDQDSEPAQFLNCDQDSQPGQRVNQVKSCHAASKRILQELQLWKECVLQQTDRTLQQKNRTGIPEKMHNDAQTHVTHETMDRDVHMGEFALRQTNQTAETRNETQNDATNNTQIETQNNTTNNTQIETQNVTSQNDKQNNTHNYTNKGAQSHETWHVQEQDTQIQDTQKQDTQNQDTQEQDTQARAHERADGYTQDEDVHAHAPCPYIILEDSLGFARQRTCAAETEVRHVCVCRWHT